MTIDKADAQNKPRTVKQFHTCCSLEDQGDNARQKHKKLTPWIRYTASELVLSKYTLEY